MFYYLVKEDARKKMAQQIVQVAPGLFGGLIGHELREMLSHAQAMQIPEGQISNFDLPINAWLERGDQQVVPSRGQVRRLILSDYAREELGWLAFEDFPVSKTLHRRRLIVFPGRRLEISGMQDHWAVILGKLGRIPADTLWSALRFQSQPADYTGHRLFRKSSWWKRSSKVVGRLFTDPPATFLFGQLVISQRSEFKRLDLAARLSGIVTLADKSKRINRFEAVQIEQRAEALSENSERYDRCFQKLFDLKAG